MSGNTNKSLTIIESMIEQTELRIKNETRTLILALISRLHSLTPDFDLIPSTVANLDSRIGEYDGSWPRDLNRRYGNQVSYIQNIATYKNVPISISVDSNGVEFKFPTVTLRGMMIDSYTARGWKRANRAALTTSRYYRHDPPHEWELKAFRLDRVPTSAEFLAQSNLRRIREKFERNVFRLDWNDLDNIPNQLEKAYLKYQASLKKVTTFEENSNKTAYKAYLTHRGNPCLVTYKTTHANQEIKK